MLRQAPGESDRYQVVDQARRPFLLEPVEDSEGGLIPLSTKSWKRCIHGCFDDHKQELRDTRRLQDRNSPLRGLELFSGKPDEI